MPDSPTPGTPAPGPEEGCPNDLSVPDGYPPLGGTCRTHVWIGGGAVTRSPQSLDRTGLVSEDWIAFSDTRGARRQPGSTVFDIGYASDSDAFSYLGILVPSVGVGRWTGNDGAAVRERLSTFLSVYGSDVPGGAVDVEIVGRSGDLLWGRFLAVTCALDESCKTMNGRFSAQVDVVSSEVPFGFAAGPYDDRVEFCWDDAADCQLPSELPGCGVARCVRRECYSEAPPSCI
jgi:hypothetical protein